MLFFCDLLPAKRFQMFVPIIITFMDGHIDCVPAEQLGLVLNPFDFGRLHRGAVCKLWAFYTSVSVVVFHQCVYTKSAASLSTASEQSLNRVPDFCRHM